MCAAMIAHKPHVSSLYSRHESVDLPSRFQPKLILPNSAPMKQVRIKFSRSHAKALQMMAQLSALIPEMPRQTGLAVVDTSLLLSNVDVVSLEDFRKWKKSGCKLRLSDLDSECRDEIKKSTLDQPRKVKAKKPEPRKVKQVHVKKVAVTQPKPSVTVKPKAVKKAKPVAKAKPNYTETSIEKEFIRRIESGNVVVARQFLRDCFGVDRSLECNDHGAYQLALKNMNAFVKEHVGAIKASCLLSEVQLSPVSETPLLDDGVTMTMKVGVRKVNPLFGQPRQKKYIKSSSTLTYPKQYVDWLELKTPITRESGEPMLTDLTCDTRGTGRPMTMVRSVIKSVRPLLIGALMVGQVYATEVVDVPVADSYVTSMMGAAKAQWHSAKAQQTGDTSFYAPELPKSIGVPWSEKETPTVSNSFIGPLQEIALRRQRVTTDVMEVEQRQNHERMLAFAANQLQRLTPVHLDWLSVLASTTEPVPVKQVEPTIVNAIDDEQAKSLEEFAQFNPNPVKVRVVKTNTVKGLVRSLKPMSGAQIVYDMEVQRRAEERVRYQEWYMSRPDLMNHWEREKKWLLSFDSGEQLRLDNALRNHWTTQAAEDQRYKEYWEDHIDNPKTLEDSLATLEHSISYGNVTLYSTRQVIFEKVSAERSAELKIQQHVKEVATKADAVIDTFKQRNTQPKKKPQYVVGVIAPTAQRLATPAKPEKKVVVLPPVNSERYAIAEALRTPAVLSPKAGIVNDMLKQPIVDINAIRGLMKDFRQNESGVLVPT